MTLPRSVVVGVVIGLLLFTAMPLAGAAPGDLTLASTSSAGSKGNGNNIEASVSRDGSRIAFRSTASNLHPDDTDTKWDVYVKDLASGALFLASTSSGGVKGDGESTAPSLSADANKVAFASSASNLDPDDTDGTSDLFVKDLATGGLTLVANGNGSSFGPVLSADGTKLAFWSVASNLHVGDVDTDADVYVKDLVTGLLTLASTSTEGAKGNGASIAWDLSDDGTKIAFISNASNLDPTDADDFPDVYIKDLTTGTLKLASTSTGGTKSVGNNFHPSLSADGRKVAFTSSASNLDPGDADSHTDVFVKDLTSGKLTLASTSTEGTKGHFSSQPSLSADGNRVAFSSRADNLDPGDSDISLDVYLKDLVSGMLTLASTSTGGTKGNNWSYAPSLSADGSRVSFISDATNLDAGDIDTLSDVYLKEVAVGASDPGGPSVLSISPATVTLPVGGTYAATVTASEPVVGGLMVMFDAQGVTFANGGCFLDASGQCSFSYSQGTPGQPGIDTVTAWVDTNNNMIRDADEATATAQVTWGSAPTFQLGGFSAPVDSPPNVNVAKAGQVIPLKFTLTDHAGNPVTNLESVTLKVTGQACDLGSTADQLEEYASGASGLQNLGGGNYQFNWATPKSYAKSCKEMTLSLPSAYGGGSLTADFRFTK